MPASDALLVGLAFGAVYLIGTVQIVEEQGWKQTFLVCLGLAAMNFGVALLLIALYRIVGESWAFKPHWDAVIALTFGTLATLLIGTPVIHFTGIPLKKLLRLIRS